MAGSRDGQFIIRDFRFGSGERLPELRLHYGVLGQPTRDAQGRIDNAVLILHGTGVSSRVFLEDRFAGVLFGPGQPLDVRRYFIILPDAIGHGRSSKPSDGLRTRFPEYDYQDIVRAQHALVTQGLGIDHMRLVLGTSMGGMQTYLWGETHPEFMDALMPLACLPVEIAGRNRLWRKLVIEAIRTDPDWCQGEYATQPVRALRAAAGLLLIVSSAPIRMQRDLPNRRSADEYLHTYMQGELASLDANDLLYQVNASREYDPAGGLARIGAPLLHINSSDDFVNPPELGIAERLLGSMPNARFILLPASDETHGHATHTWAALWHRHLAEFLERTRPQNR